MGTFAELVASRRDWIEKVLKPWCRSASLADLVRAEGEWNDLAGRVDPQSTLWTWAWSRFPQLVHDQLGGIDETHEVQVTLRGGQSLTGYPDNRKSAAGRLVLHLTGVARAAECEPIAIDDVVAVARR